MASVQKYRDGYRAFVWCQGVRDSAIFRTKREADAWAASRETEIRQKKANPDKHTLREALEKYRDEVSENNRGARWEQLRIDTFLRSMPSEKRIGEITPSDLAAWRDQRLKEVAPGTVLRELGLISAIFEKARKEWGWMSINPVKEIRKPSEPPHRDRVISRKEIRVMLTSLGYKKGQCRGASHAVAHAFLLALRTGMRAGEICALRWDQVHDDYLAGVGTKTGPRDVPLTRKAARIIEAMRGYDKDFVIGVSPQSLDALFRKHRARAKLSGFTFHDSRHTAATWMANKLHVLDLCKAFGWANTKRALSYYNPSASDIASRLN